MKKKTPFKRDITALYIITRKMLKEAQWAAVKVSKVY